MNASNIYLLGIENFYALNIMIFISLNIDFIFVNLILIFFYLLTFNGYVANKLFM
jgi:hypothetical protein